MILQLPRRPEQSNPVETVAGRSALTRRVRGGLALYVEAKVEENIELRARFSLLLHRAVEESYILGDELQEQYQILRNLERLGSEEAEAQYERLEARIRALESTTDDLVSLHGEADAQYAGFAFKYMRPEDYTAIGLEAPAEPGEFTRIGARRAVAYLYGQKRAQEAA
ncbi:MAG: hypothetical protein C4332_13385 [Meiothermus sp.]